MATSPDHRGRFPVRDVLAESVLLASYLGSLSLNAWLLGHLPLHGWTYCLAVGTLTAAEMSMGLRIAAYSFAPIREFLEGFLKKRPPPS